MSTRQTNEARLARVEQVIAVIEDEHYEEQGDNSKYCREGSCRTCNILARLNEVLADELDGPTDSSGGVCCCEGADGAVAEDRQLMSRPTHGRSLAEPDTRGPQAKDDEARKSILADPTHPCWALMESVKYELCVRHQYDNPTTVPCAACVACAMEWVGVPVAVLLDAANPGIIVASQA